MLRSLTLPARLWILAAGSVCRNRLFDEFKLDRRQFDPSRRLVHQTGVKFDVVQMSAAGAQRPAVFANHALNNPFSTGPPRELNDIADFCFQFSHN